ncbi:AbfB domain-containing protein [Streptomyces massasporeus]|uniref:AbfB domain-containing protein n=1 Tax=Streptomyces massasporeus TaxID=67324 RepID=A0ABW6L7G4_9ACTN
MWLEKNDGSTRFASDATFRQRAGLADPAGVSYESSNYPGRYVRHWEYLLNVQAVSTPTDRVDATFHTQ